MNKLNSYHNKRNFNETLEPQGRVLKSKDRLIFVVQHHLARREHYDLRLEWGGVLISFAVPKEPSYDTKIKRLAVHVEDHPIEYASFSGEIAKGQYGAGTVTIYDSGYWQPSESFENFDQIKTLKFTLYGKKLFGDWALIKTNEPNWLLIKEREKLQSFDISNFDFQLCSQSQTVPEGKEWIYEIKYDGYRMLLVSNGIDVNIYSRSKQNYTSKLANFINLIKEWANASSFAIDGEIVMFDKEGKSDFGALQTSLKEKTNNLLVFIAFDIVYLNGKDLKILPLIERKNKLKTLLNNAPSNIYFCPHLKNKANQSFNTACKLGLEGIVAKNLQKEYLGTRNDAFVKIKCKLQGEFYVGGVILSKSTSYGIGAVILATKNGLFFEYAGRAGSGLNQANVKMLLSNIVKTKCSQIIKLPKALLKETVIWAKPSILVSIEYTEKTKLGSLRHPIYKGIVNSKQEISLPFKITNPERIIYPHKEITKQDVINYYTSIAPYILPFIVNRPLSVVKCPSNINACFFNKHIKTNNYLKTANQNFYITDELGLIYLVQNGAIEFHTYASTVDAPNNPNVLVFDLDPDEKLELDAVKQGVRDLKQVLDKLNLISFLKTSGNKGYHIIVPFEKECNWLEFRNFAQEIAKALCSIYPNKYTSNMRKSARENKIYIDWVRNTKGATSVAPYSLRANKQACVSAPISWQELDSIAPNGIDMVLAIKRAKTINPWKDYF